MHATGKDQGDWHRAGASSHGCGFFDEKLP
jgi:hypothetical protein